MPPPQIEKLVISIDEASYNEAGNIASIKIQQAFKTSKIIRSYNGAEITLIYKNNKLDLKNCPFVRVKIKNVARDINFSENSVTIKISNINKQLANNIEKQLCLKIDTKTLKKVSSINYDPSSPNDLKDLTSTLNE